MTLAQGVGQRVVCPNPSGAATSSTTDRLLCEPTTGAGIHGGPEGEPLLAKRGCRHPRELTRPARQPDQRTDVATLGVRRACPTFATTRTPCTRSTRRTWGHPVVFRAASLRGDPFEPTTGDGIHGGPVGEPPHLERACLLMTQTRSNGAGCQSGDPDRAPHRSFWDLPQSKPEALKISEVSGAEG